MILIFLNSKGLYGGVEMLASRFATYLKSKEIPFMIAEGRDTRIANLHPENSLINPDNIGDVSSKISSVFFPNFAKIRTIEKDFHKISHANTFGWIVHPNEPFRSFYPFSSKLIDLFGYSGVRPLQILLRRHTKLVHNLFDRAILAGGLVSMDGATSRSLRYYFPGLSQAPEVLPIPSPVSHYFGDVIERREIPSIGYLGRLDAFKMSALQPFLLEYSKVQRFSFHLIGEGDGLSKVKSICRKCNIDLFDYGFMENTEAKKILRENVDFCIAMGTAALDMAGAGVPCIIIDPSMKSNSLPQRKFRFVHEIKEYTLGEYRDFPMYKQGLHRIDELYEIVREDTQIGKKGRDYVENSHNPERVFNSLVDKIRASRLSGGEACRLTSVINKSFHQIKFYSRDS